jgi:hypothetical protein
MIMTNAERQRRFRERQRDEARARIIKYQAAIDTAQEWVRKIDAGWRFERAAGNASMSDCTDEIRADKLAEVERYRELIQLWSKDAGVESLTPKTS